MSFEFFDHFNQDYLSVIAHKLFIALIVALLFYALIKSTKKLTKHISKRYQLNESIEKLLGRISSSTLGVIGVITVLGTLGVNVSALVAGLGLTGFAMGFAFKDTISNLLSGLLILLYRPFVIGNSIKVGVFEGKVVSIDLRYTELDNAGEKILIPNSKLFTDPIIVR